MVTFLKIYEMLDEEDPYEPIWSVGRGSIYSNGYSIEEKRGLTIGSKVF